MSYQERHCQVLTKCIHHPLTPKGSGEYWDLVHSRIPHENVALLHLPSSADAELHKTLCNANKNIIRTTRVWQYTIIFEAKY